MIPSEALDRVIEKETFAEILTCLTPEELAVAALRLEGLSNAGIGTLLGMSRQAVRKRLVKAQIRIIYTRPELAPALRGRRPSNGTTSPPVTLPLEHGWLYDPRQAVAKAHDDGQGIIPQPAGESKQ